MASQVASETIARSLAAILLVALAIVATSCGGGLATSSKSKATAVLVVKCEHRGAEVWIDSRYSRSAGEFARGLRLRPGSYRVEVRQTGYHSMYYEVVLVADQRRTLDVQLARKFR